MSLRAEAFRVLAVVGLVVLMTGCASSHKMSSKALCENAGGKYAQGTCSPGSTKSAQQMCLAHGGIYLQGEDTCDIPYK